MDLNYLQTDILIDLQDYKESHGLKPERKQPSYRKEEEDFMLVFKI